MKSICSINWSQVIVASLLTSSYVAANQQPLRPVLQNIQKRSDYADVSVEFEVDPSTYEEPDGGRSCDNGDDLDDGSQWHSEVEVSDKPATIAAQPQGVTPFPAWLRDLTGLNEWPGLNPPYIPLTYINLNGLPDVPLRSLGNCTAVKPEHCAFDCNRCAEPDDITTCSVLTQTFDDGPGPATPKLLDNLGGRTTFFTQGINVVRFPDTFRTQHQKGHLLASHTWSHGNLAGLSNEEVAAQIQWSIWAMNATAGLVPKYFRPPYGAVDSRVRAISRQFGLTNVFWDKDTFDWKVNDKQKTSDEVLKDVKVWKSQEGGGILLEHDSTIDVVNVGIEIAKEFAAAGYPQRTVAECANMEWYQKIYK